MDEHFIKLLQSKKFLDECELLITECREDRQCCDNCPMKHVNGCMSILTTLADIRKFYISEK